MQEAELQRVISKIRKGGDPETLFSHTRDFSREQFEKYNSRWLVSILDTYGDYGTDIEAANAVAIVGVVNMIRLAATVYQQAPPKIKYRTCQPFHEGLNTMHLDLEDTLLNQAKRLHRTLSKTPQIHIIWGILVERFKAKPNNIIGHFHKLASNKNRVLPKDINQADNHGVINYVTFKRR
jgi:hypothetical protein